MKVWISALALFALSGSAVARQATPVAAAAAAAAALPATQALFDGYVRDGRMPGIVGAFGVGDRPTVFVDAGRIAEEPSAPAAGPDSLWRIYSMTKPIAAMAAMILIEEGRLGLDDPVASYFPKFAHMRVATSPDTSLASVPARNVMTIRQLLTHSSGLTYNIFAKGPLLREYERLGLLPGAVNRAVEAQVRPTRPTTLAEFADRLASVPLIAEPGTQWHYSVGLDLIGAVVERVSGMPFDRFVQARLLDPLKMRSTYWTVPAGEAGRLATNYAFVGDKRVALDPGASSAWLAPPSFPYGGAGLVSSARDYDRFLHMLADQGRLDGVRVMKARTVRLALSNLLPAGVYYTGLADGTGGTPSGSGARAPMGYGAGGSVYIADVPGGPAKGTYGWGGAAGTIAWVDPVRRIRGTVMVQYFPAERWPLRREVGAALAQDLGRR